MKSITVSLRVVPQPVRTEGDAEEGNNRFKSTWIKNIGKKNSLGIYSTPTVNLQQFCFLKFSI